MKKKALVQFGILFLLLLLPATLASANSQLDISGSRFYTGEFSNTEVVNNKLQLSQSAPGQYVSSGTWTSGAYDLGKTSMWGWFWAEQPLSDFPNLLPNGGFETDTSPADGIPDGWTFNVAAARRDTQNVVSGSYSLRIDPSNFPSGGAYHIQSPPILASGSNTYHILVHLTGDVNEAGAIFYMTYYNSVTRQSISGGPQLHGSGRAAQAYFPFGTLLYYTASLTIPPGADSVRLSYAVSGHGPIWLDDLYVFTESRTSLETRTSADKVQWTDWEAPRLFFDNRIAIGSTQARYIQYRLTLSSHHPNFTPRVSAVHHSFDKAFPVPLPYGLKTRKFFSPARDPAGFHGFVQIGPEGHLQFEDGTRAKFWGSQDAYGDATDNRIALGSTCSMMEEMGFNLIRFDIGYWVRKDYADPSGADDAIPGNDHVPSTKDALDRAIDQCGQRGVYMYLRFYTEKRIVNAMINDPDYNKLLTLGLGSEYYFDPVIQDVVKQYTTEVLTHVNPLTTRKIGAEPTAPFIEYFNEQGMLQAFFADRLHGTCLDPANPGPCTFPKDIGLSHVAMLDTQWNSWLQSKYLTQAALIAAWGGVDPGEILGSGPTPGTVRRILYSQRGNYSRVRFYDTVEFYTKVEEDFYRTMADHLNSLRASDGVRTLAVGTQTLGISRAATKAQLINDVVDVHSYFDLENPFDENQKHFSSQIKNPTSAAILHPVQARALGYPYTMSEHNQTGYTDYTAEMPIFATAYGAFQDYDMITNFALNNTQSQNNSLIDNFDPVRWLQFPVASNLFFRDILPARTVIGLEYTSQETLDIDTIQIGLLGLGAAGFLSPEYILLHGVGVRQFDALQTKPASQYIIDYGLDPNPQSPYTSDTGQITLNAEEGILKVTTDGTQGAVGDLKGRTHFFPNMTLDLPPSSDESLSIFVTAIDTSSIVSASSLLLTAVSRSEPTGMKSTIDKRRVPTFGDLPVLASGVRATAILTLGSTEVQVFALDETAQRKTNVPITVVGNQVRFDLDPEYESLWYEISVHINRTPTLATIPNITMSEGEPLQLRLIATDPDGDSLTYSVDMLLSGPTREPDELASPTLIASGELNETTVSGGGHLPPGVDMNPTTGIFRWTPDYTQAGTYQFLFAASDGSLSDSQAVTITVNNVNRRPVLETIGNRTVNEDQLLNFVLTASDLDNDPLSYYAGTLPSGATFDPGTHTFSWTPDFTQAGTYANVGFLVYDGIDFDYEIITITVSNVNRPPILGTVGNRTLWEGELLAIGLTGTDPDSDPLSFYFSNLPSGSSFDAVTHTLTWRPTFTQAGTYANVGFAVFDGVAIDFEFITVTVMDRPFRQQTEKKRTLSP